MAVRQAADTHEAHIRIGAMTATELTVESVRAVLEQYGTLTIDDLAAALSTTTQAVWDVLATEEAAGLIRPTGRRLGGSAFYEYIRPKGRPKITFTDDQVIEMWEAYEDQGMSLGQVAASFNVSEQLVSRELHELGVTIRKGGKRAPDERPAPPKIDPTDPFKDIAPDEQIRFENIMAALARIGDGELSPSVYNRHLRFAQVLPHVKPGLHKRVPMSEHQRYIDRLGGGIWATIVRADLRRAGLMPR